MLCFQTCDIAQSNTRFTLQSKKWTSAHTSLRGDGEQVLFKMFVRRSWRTRWKRSRVWRQSCTSKFWRIWPRWSSSNLMRWKYFENIHWSHDRHPWSRSLHNLQVRIKQDQRMMDGSSWRISVSLCPSRRSRFSWVGSSRSRSRSQTSTLDLATKRSPSKRWRSSSLHFVKLYKGWCSPRIPQRPGSELLGSHEVADDEVRTEDVRREKGVRWKLSSAML